MLHGATTRSRARALVKDGDGAPISLGRDGDGGATTRARARALKDGAWPPGVGGGAGRRRGRKMLDHAALAAREAVMTSPDLLQCIAAQLDRGDLLVWALTCREFRTALRGAGRAIVTPQRSLVSSVPRAKWALATMPLREGMVGWMAAGVGQIEVIDFVKERGFPLDWRAMCDAATYGHLEAIKHLQGVGVRFETAEELARSNFTECINDVVYSHDPAADVMQTPDRGTCGGAAYSGSVEVLRYVREQGCPWNKDTCVQAAERGSIPTLSYALEGGCPWSKDVLASAAHGGHLELLNWVVEFLPSLPFSSASTELGELIREDAGDLCSAAARADKLEVLKFARERGFAWGQACSEAAGAGHLEVLQWAREKGAPWDSSTAAKAAEGGHLEVLQWARGHGCEWNAWTCASAAYNCHLDLLKWARAQNPPCPWDMSTCSLAAANGNLGVLQWVREAGCPWDLQTCSMAAGAGHLEVLKWARMQDPPCPWDWRTPSAAAAAGHLEVLKFCRAGPDICPWSPSVSAEAAANGHLEVLRWAMDNGNEVDGEFGEVLYDVAEGGHLEVLKFCRSRGIAMGRAACMGACQGGHMEIVRWLREDCEAEFNPVNLVFADHNGHTGIVDYLIRSGCQCKGETCDWCEAVRARVANGDDIVELAFL